MMNLLMNLRAGALQNTKINMAKKIDSKSLIHFELEKLDGKVNEFQVYLEKNSINKAKGMDDMSTDYQDKLHKEIVVQIKMQDALFAWVPLLQKLRETEADKPVETRGNVEINGLFKQKSNG